MDYIFRYLGYKFLSPEEQEEVFGQASPHNNSGKPEISEGNGSTAISVSWNEPSKKAATDAPICEKCGAMMYRTGTCYTCPNCFATSGVCQ